MDCMLIIRQHFTDQRVVQTITDIREALTTYNNRFIVDQQLINHLSQLHKLFDEEPEIICREDPNKWAELLAQGWGWIPRSIHFQE